MMKILFSSVGKSDPMTIFENLEVYDGSLLHIIRYMKPDVVYLYMSEQICKFDDLDNRYEKAIQLLADQLQTSIDVCKIKRKELVDVQKFDFFYDEFERIILDIIDKYGPETEILCNVSSGTPGMKSAIQIITALSKYKLTPIQVVDPTRGQMRRADDLYNYNIEEYFHQNIDNNQLNNRTSISNNESFSFKMQRESIIALIQQYDYEAAYYLINEYKYRIDKYYIDLLDFAKSRSTLDIKTSLRINSQYSLNLIPYKSDNLIKLFEYALLLKIKVCKNEIIDFLRGLTPFLNHASYMLLKKCYGIDMHRYCTLTNKYNLTRCLLEKDETGRNILNILDKEFKGYKDSFLSENQMLCILFSYLSPSDSLYKSLKSLDDLRKNKRNLASHEIVCIKKESIKKDLGIDIEVYLNDMRTVLEQLGYDLKYWNSYDNMNQYLINELKTLI